MVPFTLGKRKRYRLGVKSLPWLILTDQEHKVCAEGLGVTDLDDKLKQISGE